MRTPYFIFFFWSKNQDGGVNYWNSKTPAGVIKFIKLFIFSRVFCLAGGKLHTLISYWGFVTIMTQNQKPKIDTGSFLETKLSNLCLMLQFKLICCFRIEKKLKAYEVKIFVHSTKERKPLVLTWRQFSTLMKSSLTISNNWGPGQKIISFASHRWTTVDTFVA